MNPNRASDFRRELHKSFRDKQGIVFSQMLWPPIIEDMEQYFARCFNFIVAEAFRDLLWPYTNQLVCFFCPYHLSESDYFCHLLFLYELLAGPVLLITARSHLHHYLSSTLPKNIKRSLYTPAHQKGVFFSSNQDIYPKIPHISRMIFHEQMNRWPKSSWMNVHVKRFCFSSFWISVGALF